MKKMYVEEILLNKNNIGNTPGAGTYEHKKGFGGVSNDALQSRTCYSMRQKLYMDDLALSKSKKLPGPGFYQHPDCLSANVSSSLVKTSQKFSVPKANDRFRVGRFNVPAPDSY